MHICRVTAVFVGFEKFGLVLKLNFQAVIKSAASAASPKTKFENPGIQGSQRATARLVGDGNGQAPLDPWILVFGEAALAADLITA